MQEEKFLAQHGRPVTIWKYTISCHYCDSCSQKHVQINFLITV